MTCKLSRKRPSPLQGRRTKTWVVAILNMIISILIIEEVKEEEYSREKEQHSAHMSFRFEGRIYL